MREFMFRQASSPHEPPALFLSRPFRLGRSLQQAASSIALSFTRSAKDRLPSLLLGFPRSWCGLWTQSSEMWFVDSQVRGSIPASECTDKQSLVHAIFSNSPRAKSKSSRMDFARELLKSKFSMFGNRKLWFTRASSILVVYYESIKRELKIRCIYECRCDERLQTKTRKFTCLVYIVCLLRIDEAKANIKLIYECRCNERL